MLSLVLWLNAAPITISPFWPQLDQACNAVEKIEAVDATTVPHPEDVEAVVRYCRQRVAPRFAAKRDPERIARLADVLGAARLPTEIALPRVPVQPVTNLVVSGAEQELRRERAPELGLAGETILATALGALCDRSEAKAVLRATCALPSRVSLTALRLAVLRDVVTLFVEKAADQVPTSLRLVTVSLTTDDLRAVDLGSVLADPCEASPTRGTCGATARAISLARALAARILADGVRLDRDKQHYRNVVEEVAREQLGPAAATFSLGPGAAAASDALVDALRVLDDERARATHVSSTAVAERMLTALRRVVVLAAAVLGENEPSAAPVAMQLASSVGASADVALTVLDRIARADAKGALDAASASLDTLGASGKISPASTRALRVAADLAAARTESDLKRVARDAFLPLPAWVDRFVFDVNVSPPVNKSVGGDSELSLNGDLTVGYNGDRFGVVGSASSAYYDVVAGRNSALTERYAGSLDAWLLVPLGRVVRLEPRLSGGATYYGTLASDFAQGSNRQTNQDSIFGRGVASLGVRVQPGERFAFAGSFGAGGQYEDYYRVLQTSVGDQGTVFDVATTVRYEARLRAQVMLWPQILAFRARADMQAFDMRRSDQAVTYSIGRVTQNEQGVTEISQLEVFARGFLDAEIARFFGFVPAVHGGVNVFSFASNGVGTTVVVPVVGIGIRREAL